MRTKANIGRGLAETVALQKRRREVAKKKAWDAYERGEQPDPSGPVVRARPGSRAQRETDVMETLLGLVEVVADIAARPTPAITVAAPPQRATKTVTVRDDDGLLVATYTVPVSDAELVAAEATEKARREAEAKKAVGS